MCPAGAGPSTIELLSRAVLEQPDDMLERLYQLLVAAEPDGFYDEAGLVDLRQASRAGLTAVLTCLAGLRDTLDDPLRAPREAGRRQVQQGLPLEGVLRAYRIAGQALWEAFVETTRTRADLGADDLLDGATEVWRVVDEFSAAASEAFRAEELALRHQDDRLRSAVVAALLEGRGAEPQFARDAAKSLGIAADDRLVCVVALAPPTDRLAISAPKERLEKGGLASVWGTTASGEVGLVVVGTAGPSRVRELLAGAVRGRAGLSPVFTALSEVPRAARLADLAARSVTTPDQDVHVLEDDPIAALVQDSPLVAGLLHERTIGALLAPDRPDGEALLETLRAFLESDCSVNDAAERAFVHRNTMVYRLNKIEKITGLRVRVPRDQLVLLLALKHNDLRGH